MSYRIFTDSGCDLDMQTLEKWNVTCIPLTWYFEDDPHTFPTMEPKAFFDEMRAGRVAKTSAVNAHAFMDAFRKSLDASEDVIYIGFSSGLSVTVHSAFQAANELKSEYPEREIIAIDTVSASGGQGLLVYDAVRLRDRGATIHEIESFILENYPKVAHWFTVDDLVYLKRGGRISATTALLGGLLNIKPVLHLADNGKIESMRKVRGRTSAFRDLVKTYEASALDLNGPVIIVQADCIDEANKVKTMLEEKGADVVIVSSFTPVIGAHIGPGTIAVFYYGKER